jgi:hypothetical protein
VAEIIRVDGSREPVTPTNGTDFKFEQVYPLIGTDIIQIVACRDGRIMLCDEEGKLKDKPVNFAATQLYVHGTHDPIVGDVLVCDKRECR